MTDPLALDVRRKLFEFVERNPGMHFREVARRLDIAIGSLDYHSRFLEKAKLIERRDEKGKLCLFPARMDEAALVLLPLLRSLRSRQIVITLLTKGDLSHGALASEVGVSKGTLSFHLDRLRGSRVVEDVIRDKRAFLRLSDPDSVVRLLIAHKQSFLDSMVDGFIAAWSGRV